MFTKTGRRASLCPPIHPSRYVYRLRPVRRGVSNPIFRLSFLPSPVRYRCGQPGIYQRLGSHHKHILFRTRNDPFPRRKRKAHQQGQKIQAQQRKVKLQKKADRYSYPVSFFRGKLNSIARLSNKYTEVLTNICSL